ncbi:uncharacterized protein LOC107646333 [Arachis ipaensis]|uniref:uncharacterized protein LOC107646333 n=1 Tax=Arachis ipaensis TaxID=130454 RepID=UPI0007AEEAD9|nr:uncharacterized protein LOC107646333 [Arachis ipaensis]XP_025661008.1 uncharacterized protein LOC112756604 [Arachis hypogaea]
MTLFATAALKIPDLNPEVHLHALKNGLQPEKFQKAIAVAKPKTLAELRDKATGQIEIKELRETRRTEKPPSRREEERPHRFQNKDLKKRFKLIPKFDSYTKFNTKREDIINEILHNKLIKPPNKAGTYQDQKYVDISKYCAFHQKYGHTIEECIVAILIGNISQKGLLDKYVTSRNQKETIRDANKPNYGSDHKDKEICHRVVESLTSKGVINYILGDFARGEATNTSIKRSYQAMTTMDESRQETHTSPPTERIAFDASKLKSQCPNLDDPVVISIHMEELIVKRVLLDPGSSADELF